MILPVTAFALRERRFLLRIDPDRGAHAFALGARNVDVYKRQPVDCVKMAFDYLLREERVDLVISGINHGSNSAVNVLYSGTMGAAIEGSFYGCPAVGLSLDDHGEDADFEAAVAYGRRCLLYTSIKHSLPLQAPVACKQPPPLPGYSKKIPAPQTRHRDFSFSDRSISPPEYPC